MSRAVNPSPVTLRLQSQSHTTLSQMLEKQTSQNTRVGLTRLFSKNFIRGHVSPDMNRTLSTQRYCFAADDSVYPHTAQLSLLKIFNT